MRKNYTKTLMLIFTVSMIAFILPDAFAEPCGETDTITTSYVTLTSTPNSITIDLSPENVGCELPDGEVLYNVISLEVGRDVLDIIGIENKETSYTFDGLTPDTPYAVDIDVFYGGFYNNGVLVGDLDQPIQTKSISDPLPLPKEPIECEPTATTTTCAIDDNTLGPLPESGEGQLPEPEEGQLPEPVAGQLPEPVAGQLPESEEESCVDLDDLELTLTSTYDSITATWSDLPICDVPLDAKSIHLFKNEGNLIHSASDVSGSSSYTFSDLDSDNLYEVELVIHYDETFTDIAGSVFETINTEVDCIFFDERFDDFYPSLSSNADSITATWPDGPYCYVPIDAIVSTTLSLDYGGHIPAVSGHTFLDLQSLTLYTVELEFTYTDDGGDGVHTFYQNIYTKDVDYVEPNPPVIDSILEEESKGGCSGDCTPPTIGLDKDNKRLVDNGFSYNNNPVDVIAWHTPYPLITAIVNQTNTVEITVYDNQGIFYLDMIQFGLGLEDLGQALHDVEVLIEVHLEAVYSENTVIVEKVVIRDRDNLIDTFSVFAVTEVVDCIDDEFDEQCLKVTLKYSYRESTINNMMVVNVSDIARNTQNFYFNDGVEVIGESMNPTPFVILQNKLTNQQTTDLTLTLYRTDKINHIWMDENGIEYLKTGVNEFDRITPATPYTCNDPPLSEVNVPTRNNCHFRALVSFWNQ